LDYAGARYFANVQGRFTSPDELLSSGDVGDPQSWNRYSYSLNNPLRYTDPFGLYVFDSSVTEEQRRQFREALTAARAQLSKIGERYGTNSAEYNKAKRALDVYGEEGKRNGVMIVTQEGAGLARTGVAGVAGQRTADNPNGQDIRVRLDAATYSNDDLAGTIAHEGSHAADGSEWVSSGFAASRNPTNYQTEFDAHTVQSLVGEAINPRSDQRLMLPHYRNRRGVVLELPEIIYVYRSSWAEADRATLRKTNIDAYLARPRNRGGDYGLAPNRQGGPSFRRGARF